MKGKLPPAVFLSLLFLYSHAAVPDSSSAGPNLTQLSLEELMSIPIYSIVKSEEPQFDAPLSSSVITRAEIKKAGCTTIMEALKLVPGVIVRQMTNGNYDIHIRGLDNVPPNLGMYFFTNATTLVMIDSRPVYNYVQGGTFWETLPIDLNDVDKIEVVRGPAAAMYGPNAESGVINIITRNPEKTGWYVVGNGQYGNYNTGIANASVGYNVKNKFTAIVSGNFQNRERTQRDYYNNVTNTFVPIDSFVTNDSLRKERYPHPRLAMRKYGYNAFLTYNINNKASISLQGGGQGSEVQDEFASAFLTTAVSKSYYANLKAAIYGFNLQGSFLTGHQAPQAGAKTAQWNFNTIDVVADYNMTAVKNFVLTPGFNYRREEYCDLDYANATARNGLFNARVQAYNFSGSLRADYKLFNDKLRLLAAARVDKFNVPSKVYFSWNFAVTYKANPRHIIRIAESRANQCPLLLNSYYNLSVPFYTPLTGLGTIQLLGNKNLQLLTTDMLEIGYRGKIMDNLEVDVEIFGSSTKNLYNMVFTTLDSSDGLQNYLYSFQNIPLVARQFGGTLSLTFVKGKIEFRPFITVQHTTLFNYSPYAVLPSAPTTIFSPKASTQNINSGLGTQMTHVATPTVYGGAYFNFAITKELNLNVNAYYMSKYTQLEADNTTYHNGLQGVENVTPQFMMNVVASYTFFKKLTLFANFKNIFNDHTRQFYRADIPGFLVSGGINFEL